MAGFPSPSIAQVACMHVVYCICKQDMRARVQKKREGEREIDREGEGGKRRRIEILGPSWVFARVGRAEGSTACGTKVPLLGGEDAHAVQSAQPPRKRAHTHTFQPPQHEDWTARCPDWARMSPSADGRGASGAVLTVSTTKRKKKKKKKKRGTTAFLHSRFP